MNELMVSSFFDELVKIAQHADRAFQTSVPKTANARKLLNLPVGALIGGLAGAGSGALAAGEDNRLIGAIGGGAAGTMAGLGGAAVGTGLSRAVSDYAGSGKSTSPVLKGAAEAISSPGYVPLTALLAGGGVGLVRGPKVRDLVRAKEEELPKQASQDFVDPRAEEAAELQSNPPDRSKDINSEVLKQKAKNVGAIAAGAALGEGAALLTNMGIDAVARRYGKTAPGWLPLATQGVVVPAMGYGAHLAYQRMREKDRELLDEAKQRGEQ